MGRFSRGLSPAERRCCATEIQGLDVVWAVAHLRSILEATEILVRCDHTALPSDMAS